MYAGYGMIAMTVLLAPASAVACQYDDLPGGRFSPFHARMAQQNSGDRFVDAILAEQADAPYDWRKPDEERKDGDAASPFRPAATGGTQDRPAA